MNGMINVYKEAGYTSHDVVARLRGIVKQKKIGHTGTLDPQAVGVLPVCLGNATKLCDLLTDHDKEYEAVLQLGVVTDTQDLTGTILEEKPVLCSEQEVRQTVLSFLGAYQQIPPMYSALKVNGRKLYDLARQGIEVERKPRPVQIYELQICELSLPFVRFRVCCSKGTYIRTLCQDIGEKLGCGGAMKSLKRTRVGIFTLDSALTLGELEKRKEAGGLEEILIPVDQLFSRCPGFRVTQKAFPLLRNGNLLLPEQLTKMQDGTETDPVRIYDPGDRFYGLYRLDQEQKVYRPYKMFLPGEE